MSNWPFSYVHAADFHLEKPPFGVAEVPEHLEELFLEASYWAAERVFDAVLAEEADFLVLSGDVLDPRWTGPRGPLFLAEQFGRLAQQGIGVYWAGGSVDPPDAWPSAISLPENVHVFPSGRPEHYVHQRDAVPLARLIGASRGQGRTIRADDFAEDPAGLFSIGVVHGTARPQTLKARGINYWALGGSHSRQTLFSSPYVAHYPGSPQGRQPSESGPHGCTLVQVDQQRRAHTSLVPTDAMRWQNERILVDDHTGPSDLETMIHERMQTLVETFAGMDLLISWTVAGSGPLLAELRRGTLGSELLTALRQQYGFGPPAAWSISLTAEAIAVLPPEWYEQETIRGDFLRSIRHRQINRDVPLELDANLSDPQLAETLESVASLADTPVRERLLRDAAMLGIDLLSGEENQS